MYKIRVNIRGCKKIEELAEFVRSNNIRLILFAETHGFLNETQIQKKIIQSVNPDFFLYEMLEESKILSAQDVKKLLNKPDKKDFSFISTYGDLKPTIRLARSFDLPIIGCDIKDMCVKTKNWINEKYSKDYWSKVIKKREKRQAKIINQYVKRGLVFVSVGAYHLRKESMVIKDLNENKFIIIFPLFNGKEKFIIPRNQEKQRVSFGIKLMRKR